MTRLTIPEAVDAERDIAGCCAASRHGAVLAHQRLSVSDFYTPGAGRVFAAAVAPELAGLGHDERVKRLAELADVDLRWLERCVWDRPVQVDVTGSVAHQVKDAARRRQLMRVASDAYALAAGGDVAEALHRLEEVAHAC